MSSHKNDDIQVVFGLIVLGGFLVISGIRRFRRARMTQDTVHIPIASAPQGQVEIQGYAWAKSAPVTTLYGHKAVYSLLELQQRVKRGKNHKWETQWSTCFQNPFFVLDHSGVVEVDPKQADLELSEKFYSWSTLPQAARQMAMSLPISASGFPPSTGFFGNAGSFRFKERCILLGCPVYLHGTLKAKGSRAALPPSPAIKRFREFLGRVRGKKLTRVAQLDVNHDGKVSEEEARDGIYKVSELSMVHEASQGGVQPPLPGEGAAENVIYGDVVSSADRPLYIADCHEDHLLQRIGSNNMLRIVGGALLIGGAVAYLSVRIRFL